MTMHQAQDQFAAEIDGVSFVVRKGEVYAAGHPLVKLDNDKDGKPRGVLFKPLDLDDAETPAKKTAAKAEA